MDNAILQELLPLSTFQNMYDDIIGVQHPEDYHPSIISNVIGPDDPQRQIVVKLFYEPGAPDLDRISSGVYERQPKEESIKATLVDQSDKVLASHVLEYGVPYVVQPHR